MVCAAPPTHPHKINVVKGEKKIRVDIYHTNVHIRCNPGNNNTNLTFPDPNWLG